MDLTELKVGPMMESFVNMERVPWRAIHREDTAMRESKRREVSNPAGWLLHIAIKVEFCLMRSTTD